MSLPPSPRAFHSPLKFGGKIFIYAAKFLFPNLTTQWKNKNFEITIPSKKSIMTTPEYSLGVVSKSLMTMISSPTPPWATPPPPTNTTNDFDSPLPFSEIEPPPPS